jgi:mRNA interferase HigB
MLRALWITGIESRSAQHGGSFAEVKQSFNTADFVAPSVVFDIGGNKYRLIAGINFSRSVLFIRGIMTHNEYMKGAWKRS